MEIFTSALIGGIVSILMQFAKKTGLSTSNLFALFALLCGLLWSLIEVFGPVGLTDNIFDFASKVVGSAAIVYSLFHSLK